MDCTEERRRRKQKDDLVLCVALEIRRGFSSNLFNDSMKKIKVVYSLLRKSSDYTVASVGGASRQWISRGKGFEAVGLTV